MAVLIKALKKKEELQHYHRLAMLQVPTVKNGPKKEQAEPPPDTVRDLEDGSVEVMDVDIQPTSIGREWFGKGTKDWEKYVLDVEPVAEFHS